MAASRHPLRILLYSHDSYGLGHVRRSLALAGALTERDANASCLVVSGSPVPDLFSLPPRCEILKVPCLTKDAGGGYVPRSLPLSSRDLVDVRSSVLTATVRSFRPHAVVVDHTESGPHGELLPILRRLRHEQLRTRVVLGLRDIIDAPHLVRAQMRRQGSVALMRDYYDDIFVYGDPSILDVGAAYDLPADVRTKLCYVGIACVAPTPVAVFRGRAETSLVASAGGGEDGYDVLRGVLGAVRGPMRHDALSLTVVAGPLMNEKDYAALVHARQDDGRIRVLRSVSGMGDLVAGADLVIGMAGYNSVYETLAAGRRMLVHPRRHPRQEQLERASRLAELGLLRVLDAGAPQDPGAMAEAIRKALTTAPPDPERTPFPLDGTARAAQRLVGSLREPLCSSEAT